MGGRKWPSGRWGSPSRWPDADEIFYMVIARSNLLIADRPIHPETLALIGFKVKVTPASIAVPR